MEMDQQRGTVFPDSVPRDGRIGSQRGLWMLLIVSLVAVGIFAASKFRSTKIQSTQPVDGKLSIFVRTAQRGIEPISVEQAGALPVQAGGIMSLEANFAQAACAYFVWFDCEGRVQPLYPWNYDALEVTDINQPPPTRMGAKIIYSPPIGGGWNFGKQGGLETVMLLARREPVDSQMSLGPLLKLPPPPKMQHREELVGFLVKRGEDSVTTFVSKNRASEEESRAADDEVKSLMLRLREHFDLIQVVRFAHEEESQTQTNKK